LELEETRLGVGVRQLRLTPVLRRLLGSWSLEPTTRRLDLGAGALAMIYWPPLRGPGQLGARVIFVGADALFFGERDRIVAAASHHVIPAIYEYVNSPRPVG
jgi:hypothetical protein